MSQIDTQDDKQALKMLSEYSAVTLSEAEIHAVAGARWVATLTTDSAWGPNPFCPCPDKDVFIN